MTLREACTKVTRLKAQQDMILKERSALECSLKDIEEKEKNLTEALVWVQELAALLQNEIRGAICQIVQGALDLVFPDRYKFDILFEEKRNQTEARIVLRNTEGEEVDPMSSCGGGVIDILSFSLRVSCLLLARPKRENVLVLDEPFKWLSRDLQPLAGELLWELSNSLGIQFLVVTHETDLGLQEDE